MQSQLLRIMLKMTLTYIQYFQAASLTDDLETPMIHFVGARTMSYPVFPKSTDDMPDYDPATGYKRESATLVRREVIVSQDKGCQNAIDELDLQDFGDFIT